MLRPVSLLHAPTNARTVVKYCGIAVATAVGQWWTIAVNGRNLRPCPFCATEPAVNEIDEGLWAVDCQLTAPLRVGRARRRAQLAAPYFSRRQRATPERAQRLFSQRHCPRFQFVAAVSGGLAMRSVHF